MAYSNCFRIFTEHRSRIDVAQGGIAKSESLGFYCFFSYRTVSHVIGGYNEMKCWVDLLQVLAAAVESG